MTGNKTIRPTKGQDQRTCLIRQTHGLEKENDLAEVVKHACAANPPLFSWVEPRPVDPGNRFGPLPGFQGLKAGPPREGVELDEARLFWETSALHLVASNVGGCRWSLVEEIDRAQDVLAVRREEHPVILQQDWSRFGLEPQSEPRSDLVRIVYKTGGRIVAWRLAPLPKTFTTTEPR